VVIRTNPLSIETERVQRICPSIVHKEETNIRRMAATISCTIRNPIAIFPYTAHISPLSEISFMMIIVLLKVMAIAIYKASILVNHKSLITKNPIVEVKNTCHNQVISDILPVSFMVLAFNPIQTIKSSKDIPI